MTVYTTQNHRITEHAVPPEARTNAYSYYVARGPKASPEDDVFLELDEAIRYVESLEA